MRDTSPIELSCSDRRVSILCFGPRLVPGLCRHSPLCDATPTRYTPITEIGGGNCGCGFWGYAIRTLRRTVRIALVGLLYRTNATDGFLATDRFFNDKARDPSVHHVGVSVSTSCPHYIFVFLWVEGVHAISSHSFAAGFIRRRLTDAYINTKRFYRDPRC